ncbi:nucleotidyltransferase family protein [Gaetbulibacter sp. M235]|uniref:nucleotidyltransferase family protein n=1 Tax=Gaetbulibacter sp. M235 TaxID=3126510 RepID=UPI00374F503A
MSTTTIIILAAGASTRMGSPKQLLKWENSNLLCHAINTALNVGDVEVIVVLGANYKQIQKEIMCLPVTIIKNDNWKEGLGNSIAFSISFIKQSLPKTDHVLVMLADQPLIDSTYLKLLISKYKQDTTKIVCTLYHQEKSGVPVIFNKAYFDELLQLNQDKGAKEVLKKHSKDLKFVDGKDVIVDIDTMEDYKILYKKHHIENR